MNTTLFTIDEFTPDTHLAPGGYDTTEVIDDGNPDTYLLRQTSFQTCDWVAPGERIEGGTRVYEWREPRANWDARIHEARQRKGDEPAAVATVAQENASLIVAHEEDGEPIFASERAGGNF